MLDNVKFIFDEYLKLSIYEGFKLGFAVWAFSWCFSQIIHFFKAISR